MKTVIAQVKTPRILVVEDDPDIRELLMLILTQQGYDVDTADSGLTGLASLETAIPDVILLDLAMPEMDGLAFLQRRGQIDKIRDIPVIVVSARDSNADVMAALQAGASNYITKPFDTARLLACVQRLMTLSAAPANAGTDLS